MNIIATIHFYNCHYCRRRGHHYFIIIIIIIGYMSRQDRKTESSSHVIVDNVGHMPRVVPRRSLCGQGKGHVGQ